MIPTLLERNAVGYVTPEINPDCTWINEELTVATREYDGIKLRKGKIWQYATVGGWANVYPKRTLWQHIIGEQPDSTFVMLDELENAESPFTDVLDRGEYWLVPPGKHGKSDVHTLIPVDKADQISNINELELHEQDPADTFDLLRNVFATMRRSVYGVIFTTKDGKQARLRSTDFDWTEHGTDT